MYINIRKNKELFALLASQGFAVCNRPPTLADRARFSHQKFFKRMHILPFPSKPYSVHLVCFPIGSRTEWNTVPFILN